MSNALVDSLEMTAEIAGDIAPDIYTRYFELCPGSRSVMLHTDEHMRGRMIEEVYRLLMSEGVNQEKEYLAFETSNHNAYGAAPYMYENLLLAVRDVVKRSLGASFTAEMEAAWQGRIGELLNIIRPLTLTAKGA